jgi:hypothetical protein
LLSAISHASVIAVSTRASVIAIDVIAIYRLLSALSTDRAHAWVFPQQHALATNQVERIEQN